MYQGRAPVEAVLGCPCWITLTDQQNLTLQRLPACKKAVVDSLQWAHRLPS